MADYVLGALSSLGPTAYWMTTGLPGHFGALPLTRLQHAPQGRGLRDIGFGSVSFSAVYLVSCKFSDDSLCRPFITELHPSKIFLLLCSDQVCSLATASGQTRATLCFCNLLLPSDTLSFSRTHPHPPKCLPSFTLYLHRHAHVPVHIHT